MCDEKNGCRCVVDGIAFSDCFDTRSGMWKGSVLSTLMFVVLNNLQEYLKGRV